MYLSYLMGVENEDVKERDLEALGIEVVNKPTLGPYKIKIPDRVVEKYKSLVRDKLVSGYWNEFVGEKEIGFIFKFKDGTIKEYVLEPENELEISLLCSEFNGDAPEKTAIVYKYLSENDFYHDFMLEHYRDQIER